MGRLPTQPDEIRLTSTLYIAGREYIVDPLLWELLEGHEDVPPVQRCNGCGPEFSFLLAWAVPDKIFGVHIDPACAIHDAQCEFGGSRRDFYITSQGFGRNVYRCLNYAGVGRRAAVFAAGRARFAVHVFGDRAFRWSANETPSPRHRRALEAWSMNLVD